MRYFVLNCLMCFFTSADIHPPALRWSSLIGFFLQLLIWNWKIIDESSEEGATSVHEIKKEGRRPYRGRFFKQSKGSFDTSDLFWKYESAEGIDLWKLYCLYLGIEKPQL